MTKWLLIGGTVALAYLLFTTDGRLVRPGDKALPLSGGQPAQQPKPFSTPQTTVVPGASSVLADIKQAVGVLGDLGDAARKFGVFGGDETTATVDDTSATVAAVPAAVASGAPAGGAGATWV